MIDLIIVSIILFFVQLLLPTLLLAPTQLPYLLSSREEEIDTPNIVGRAQRAFNNFMESYPIFLALAILAMVLELDMITAATLYLSCRIAYLVVYLIGINYLRTLIWLGSVIGLIMMLLALV